MRIVSGTLKGRHIPIRKNFPARPTTDFAKENLFNVLNNRISFEGICVLDLFSGTGSISFEFASRQAKRVVSVEKDFRSGAFIKQTAQQLKIDCIQVYTSDAFKYLQRCGEKFDVVFADPPYQLPNLADIPQAVLESGVLAEDGLFILEHPGDYTFTAINECIEHRKYGSVNFSLFSLLEKK